MFVGWHHDASTQHEPARSMAQKSRCAGGGGSGRAPMSAVGSWHSSHILAAPVKKDEMSPTRVTTSVCIITITNIFSMHFVICKILECQQVWPEDATERHCPDSDERLGRRREEGERRLRKKESLFQTLFKRGVKGSVTLMISQ